MKGKPRLTLAEMAAQSAGTNGRLVCPKCNCTDFRTYRTSQGVAATFRYKQCRHCGHKLLTQQPPEQMIRSVETVVDHAEDDEELL
jgi:DNA-directed RNA polymerase subunit RPC12/RpoP